MPYLSLSNPGLWLVITLLFVACGKENSDKALYGKWDVIQVRGQQYINGAAFLNLADDKPNGWVEFKGNGRGEQNYSFTLGASTYPNTGTFLWEADESFIYINKGTVNELIWRREINQENMQKATYNIVVNANQNWDYTLTLTR